MSSIKTDVLMDSVHNTFHYAEMTGDMALISIKILIVDCISLSNVFEKVCFLNSPIGINHKPTDGANGLAKKCRHNNRYLKKKKKK
jgi:hypothetical protein